MYRPLLLLLAACHVDADPVAQDTAQGVATTDLCPVPDPCVPTHTERDVDGDGQIDASTDRTYNKHLALLTLDEFDGEHALVGKSEHTYDGERERSAWFDSDADGTPETTYEITWTDLEDGTSSAVVEEVSTDGPSVTSLVTYDTNGRKIANVVTFTLGGASSSFSEAWTYDARGHQLSHVVTPDSPDRPFEELTSWDDEGREVSSTFRYLDEDSPSKSKTTTWDACNKTSTASLDSGKVTNCTFSYDDLGRRTSYVCRNKGGALQYNEAWTWDAERDYRVAVDEDGDEQPEAINHHVEDDHGNTLRFEQFDADGALLTSSAATWICP